MILGTPSAPEEAQVIATLALSAGGLGLTSAQRVKEAAHFASWADCLRMVRDRHPFIAELMIRHLEEGIATCFQAVHQCKDSLTAAGLVVPSWTELSLTPPEGLEDPEPNPTGARLAESHQTVGGRILHPCCVASLERFSEGIVEVPARPLWLLPRSPHSQLREQRGSTPSLSVFSCVEGCTCLFPCLTALADVAANSTCLAHHRAVCSGWGVPSGVRRQVCREAGARVATNVFVRDMDLATFNALDGRRLEIVADGLTLWRGAQLAVDTTMVSPLRRDGSPKPRAANHDGAALEVARRKKENTFPELAGEGGRARLVVLAAEVGGRWNAETAQFLTALARARAQEVEFHPRLGTGEPIPSVQEVMREARFL